MKSNAKLLDMFKAFGDQSTYHCVVGVKPLLTLGGGVGGDEESRMGLAEVGLSVVGLEDVG
jgi:hypothetical protein